MGDGFQSSKVLFKSGSGLWYTEHTRNMIHVLAYVASMVYCYSSDMYQAPTPLHVKVLCRGFKRSILKGPPIIKVLSSTMKLKGNLGTRPVQIVMTDSDDVPLDLASSSI